MDALPSVRAYRPTERAGGMGDRDVADTAPTAGGRAPPRSRTRGRRGHDRPAGPAPSHDGGRGAPDTRRRPWMGPGTMSPQSPARRAPQLLELIPFGATGRPTRARSDRTPLVRSPRRARPASADARRKPGLRVPSAPCGGGGVAQRERSPCGMTLAAPVPRPDGQPRPATSRRPAAANPSCSTSTPTPALRVAPCDRRSPGWPRPATRSARSTSAATSRPRRSTASRPSRPSSSSTRTVANSAGSRARPASELATLYREAQAKVRVAANEALAAGRRGPSRPRRRRGRPAPGPTTPTTYDRPGAEGPGQPVPLAGRRPHSDEDGQRHGEAWSGRGRSSTPTPGSR